MPRPLPRCHTRLRPAAHAEALRGVFHALSRVEVTRLGGWERHRHAEHEVIIALRGTYRCRLNDVALRLAPGEALIVQPDDWHEDLLSPGTAYFALWCRVHERILAVRPTPEQQVVRGLAGLVDNTSELLRLADAGALPARLDAMLDALLWRLLSGLAPTTVAARLVNAPLDFAAQVAAAFAALGTRRLSVAVLARSLNLSQRTLERRCRAELGCGPARAHIRWRLSQACELLLTSDWPVQAISQALGFANPFHFSRAFTRTYGRSPAAWRRSGGNR